MPTSAEFALTPEMMREIIMDHNANPRHKRKSGDQGALTAHSSSVNCIDDIDVYLSFSSEGKVKDACWDGVSCAITTASSDILCDLLIGKTREEALSIIAEYMKMIHEEPYDASKLEEALAFANTSKQAARIHCATIAFDAFKGLLEKGKSNG